MTVARHIPNAITLARVLAVAPTAWFLWTGAYVEALLLMAVAGASDAIDGWLARQFDWGSRFGAAVDPLADKLLVGTLFVVLTVKGHLPLWVAAIAVGRDLVILSGAGVYRWLFGHIEFEPSQLSKANTLVQILVCLLLLLDLCQFTVLSDLPAAIANPWGIWLVALLGVLSGIDYVVTWGRRAVRESRASA